jgi:Kef-type K+ transport system membrane component KefB
MMFTEAFQLYSLLIILVSVLALSVFERKLKIPTLLGSVFIGILLGPSVFNFIEYKSIPEWLNFFSLIGGMLILFLIGLETNLKDLFETSKRASLMALLGMFFSGVFVLILGLVFGFTKSAVLLLIAATVVTATPTSLAILLELKKTRTKAARYLHATTILDNIAGVFFVFLLIAIHETGGLEIAGLVRIIATLIILLVVSYTVMPKISKWLFHTFGSPNPQTRITIAFSFVLFFGVISSYFLYEAALGAFLAGVVLSEIKPEYKKELMKTITDIGEGLFFPLFFLTIGLAVNISTVFAPIALLFLGVYIIAAVCGKYIGGYYGALIQHLNLKEAKAIGSGLVPRGGIGLIIAQVGLSLALLNDEQFAMVVLMVFATTVTGIIMISRSFGKLK